MFKLSLENCKFDKPLSKLAEKAVSYKFIIKQRENTLEEKKVLDFIASKMINHKDKELNK